MDRNAFRNFLIRGGRSPGDVERILASLDAYSEFLDAERAGIGTDQAKAEDLEAFVMRVEQTPEESAKNHLWALRYYFDFIANEEMRHLAGFLRQQRITRNPFKLKDFRDVNPKTIAKLEDHGIRTSDQMLRAGATPVARKELSTAAGVPVVEILELVQLSDLSRIPGVKGIRARLYHQAGFTSINAIAECEPEQLLEVTRRYVQESGFEGIAPVPAEVRHTIMTAKKLPKIIEY